jgi:hypothetical protein
MQTPVLLIIFNRSDTALQVLSRIKQAGVQKLYIYSDGPRQNNLNEATLLSTVQNEIQQHIDWPCELHYLFEKENFGPRIAIGRGIHWLFEHEEQGIIFEHDCLPDLSFFNFCETLLNKYASDEKIMHISGNNFQFGKTWGDGDYYFSHLNHIWGFATWKRAWKHYDVDMKAYPEFLKTNKLAQIFTNSRMQKIWKEIFDNTYHKQLATWDYQWTFACWYNNGLSILPNKNLVSNIGFDALALNTKNPNHAVAALQTHSLTTIQHPTNKQAITAADEYTILKVFNPTIAYFAWQKFKKLIFKA